MLECEECPKCGRRNIATLGDKLMECHDCGITFSPIGSYRKSRWSKLYQRFKKLSESTGRDKSSSYVMNIIFSPDDEHGVELGCYDIADWPRTLYLGPFKTEEEMYKAAEAKIAEAEIAVEEQVKDGIAESRLAEFKEGPNPPQDDSITE